VRLPIPPTITTTKANGKISKSAPAYTPKKGAPMTPPAAARKAPRPNIIAETKGTLIPIPLAISLSSTVARSFAPKEVFSLNTQSPMATAMEREITNNR